MTLAFAGLSPSTVSPSTVSPVGRCQGRRGLRASRTLGQTAAAVRCRGRGPAFGSGVAAWLLPPGRRSETQIGV